MEFRVIPEGKWKDGFLRKRDSRMVLNMSADTPATNSMNRMGLNTYKWLYDKASKSVCCHLSMTQLTGYKHHMDTNTRVCSILVCDLCGNVKVGKFDLRCMEPNSISTVRLPVGFVQVTPSDLVDFGTRREQMSPESIKFMREIFEDIVKQGVPGNTAKIEEPVHIEPVPSKPDKVESVYELLPVNAPTKIEEV